ncbi:sugar transferase [Nannocystis pusilla]|uniref:Sugar transferase n=1 Tax=Nannocystis pusilla TaxID=889268 RepID=A0ABS7TZJ6_9BACT|nr:sugar transferase [Nannocystis pusilla]MBZ5713615.1 sugar transferase [Nannocystis pusilla]
MSALARKRAFDLALLLPLVPLFALAVAALAVCVWLCDGRPIFFSQPRVGQGRRIFHIVKLRTMTCEADPGARRPTRFGRFLRQRGLDELPQLLVNILRGDMSLVGPRPLTPADAERLVAEHPPFARRFDVPPGLTGLAQVCLAQGPALTAALDAAYAERRSALLDLQLLLRTAWMNLVGKRRGALRTALPPWT